MRRREAAGLLMMLEDDWRQDRLQAIRAVILGLPGTVEGIGHKMLQYQRTAGFFAHLNAQNGYVGVCLGELERKSVGRVWIL